MKTHSTYPGLKGDIHLLPLSFISWGLSGLTDLWSRQLIRTSWTDGTGSCSHRVWREGERHTSCLIKKATEIMSENVTGTEHIKTCSCLLWIELKRSHTSEMFSKGIIFTFWFWFPFKAKWMSVQEKFKLGFVFCTFKCLITTFWK